MIRTYTTGEVSEIVGGPSERWLIQQLRAGRFPGRKVGRSSSWRRSLSPTWAASENWHTWRTGAASTWARWGASRATCTSPSTALRKVCKAVEVATIRAAAQIGDYFKACAINAFAEMGADRVTADAVYLLGRIEHLGRRGVRT